MLISSQRYLNDEIVEAKRAAKDYEVMISPEFVFEGETYQIILDGHHSYAAAMADGVDPEYYEADASDHDALLLDDPHDLLDATQIDSEYYNVETGIDLW